MQLSRLVERLSDVEIIGGERDREINSLSFDSGQIGEDCLFFCLVGKNSDGHDYAKKAIQKGAVAIMNSFHPPPKGNASWQESGTSKILGIRERGLPLRENYKISSNR